MDTKALKEAMNAVLPKGTDLNDIEPMVYHLPSKSVMTIQEATSLGPIVDPNNDIHVLKRADTDTMQLIEVRIKDKKKTFVRAREHKDAPWHDWEIAESE